MYVRRYINAALCGPDMGIQFKQKCQRCKRNYVLASRRQRFVICYDCQKQDLSSEIIDPAMRKLFDIPESFYQQNSFLRNIKISYLKRGDLTEKQIEAFKKAVQELKDQNAQTPTKN